MSSKTKTFEAESEVYHLMDWVREHIEAKNEEIIRNTPPDFDLEVRLVKKYRITIAEVEV